MIYLALAPCTLEILIQKNYTYRLKLNANQYESHYVNFSNVLSTFADVIHP